MAMSFSPPWWARSPHLQTILPLLRKVTPAALRRQRLELADGDFIDLDWQGEAQNGQPILILIHGLEGSALSHYARRMLQASARLGLTTQVHHHRSCSGEPNRLARSYHSGDTQDLHTNLSRLKADYPDSPLLAVGYSLGGNVLCKYLGEYGQSSLIDSGVVVSAPLQLAACAKRLESGFSRVYQRHLIKQMQQKLYDKLRHPQLGPLMPVSLEEVAKLTSFHDFDHRVTAPLHGFDGVEDYYRRASGLDYLYLIGKPTLVIHASDDPFMTLEVIPELSRLPPQVEYELHNHGGHLGFIEGGSPWRPSFYLERRIISFLFGFLSGESHAHPL
jgi:uncharacterized protein